MKKFSTGAEKDTQDKLMFQLVPPEVLRAYAEALTLGAKKYESRNWEAGIPVDECLGALYRHLNKWQLGHKINTDDGNLSHLKHVLFWVSALVTYEERGMLDDKEKADRGTDSGAAVPGEEDRSVFDYILPS